MIHAHKNFSYLLFELLTIQKATLLEISIRYIGIDDEGHYIVAIYKFVKCTCISNRGEPASTFDGLADVSLFILLHM
jgi:hypothetical protein